MIPRGTPDDRDVQMQRFNFLILSLFDFGVSCTDKVIWMGKKKQIVYDFLDDHPDYNINDLDIDLELVVCSGCVDFRFDEKLDLF